MEKRHVAAHGSRVDIYSATCWRRSKPRRNSRGKHAERHDEKTVARGACRQRDVMPTTMQCSTRRAAPWLSTTRALHASEQARSRATAVSNLAQDVCDVEGLHLRSRDPLRQCTERVITTRFTESTSSLDPSRRGPCIACSGTPNASTHRRAPPRTHRRANSP